MTNKAREDLVINVLMPDSSLIPIDHILVDNARKTLGIYIYPSGKVDAHIKAMQEKAQELIDRVKEGHKHHSNIWFLLDHQLWPKVGYGLCSISATWRELDDCLCQKWWQIVPMGGLICSASHQIRDTNVGFYGAGCPYMGIKCYW